MSYYEEYVCSYYIVLDMKGSQSCTAHLTACYVTDTLLIYVSFLEVSLMIIPPVVYTFYFCVCYSTATPKFMNYYYFVSLII